MHNYEGAWGVFPGGGESTTYLVNPPATQFVDGMSTHGRLLQYLEQGTVFNSYNQGFEYNDQRGSNATACSMRMSVFVCPSSPNASAYNGGPDPEDLMSQQLQVRYGRTDYAVTCYTDIDPQGRTGQFGSTVVTPYRNKSIGSRVDGMLAQGMTPAAAVTDGLSNTVAFIEDAGRDPFCVSPYESAYIGPTSPNAPRPFIPQGRRRYWRYMEPDNAIGVSGVPNNEHRPDRELVPYPLSTGQPAPTAGNQAGANDEPFSFHPGIVMALMGDGSVRPLKDTINILALRGLVSRSGGEAISGDSF
jgi:hypothetical protein